MPNGDYGGERAGFWGRFVFVLIVFLVLIGLAHVAAEQQGQKDARVAEALKARPAELWKGQAGEFPRPHTVLYYRIIFTIWITTLFLTVALCFYTLRRPTAVSAYWLLFWTFSYLAYLCHFYWAALVLFQGDLTEILHSKLGVDPDPEKVVCNPIPDLVLTAWWGLDVILAWVVFWSPTSKGQNPRWLQLERGAITLFAFVAFFGATVLAAKAEMVVRVLGVLMVVSVLACFGVRIVTRRMEPSSLSAFLYVKPFQVLNLLWPWYRLPTWVGVMNLGALREVLRAKNLHGTADIPVTDSTGLNPTPPFDARYLTELQEDGYYNDLHQVAMGSGSILGPGQVPGAGNFATSNPYARFGRNVPRQYTYPQKEAELLEPNPRRISRRLLERTTLKEAGILNFLAAAWIQFETHDWFFHGNPILENPFEIALDADDPWRQQFGQTVIKIRRTRPDPTRRPNDGAGPPTYVNAESHWWDASQIYGSDPATARKLRSDPGGNLLPGGKLYVDQNSLLARDAAGAELTGFNGNWWIGLTLLHTLFTREHNAICEHLKSEYAHWNDEQIFSTARLVNAALMAKIHTAEWTPAILPNPALKIGMNANWWGLFGAHVKKAFGRISENEAFSGIPGTETEHHAAEYTLTEEFVAVYRMHPLMRDWINLCRADDGGTIAEKVPLKGLLGADARAHILPDPRYAPGGGSVAAPSNSGTMSDWLYSFGICSPGALVLHNYPNFLREFKRPDGDLIDLATVDVLRDRERGVPRYNQFRKLLHLPAMRSYKQLCQNDELARELEEVYGGDINRLDLMVGMFAEPPPPLFGFSDTAFRIFILMASRRLKSDRFLTTDFTPEVYSPAGLDWVANNGMISVLLRHYPDLAPALRGRENAFAPWRTIADSERYQPYDNGRESDRSWTRAPANVPKKA
jgi:hypothetical protein